MAKCEWCKLEMTKADGCNQIVEFPDGKKIKPIPHIGENRCWDCNVTPGNLHHPGCDNEICPICGGQLIGCGCLDI